MIKLGKTIEQDAASKDIDNHSLIIAMAGSGKTKTLIDKVELILSQNDTNTVLMVTFTNAAVNEMKERLEIRLSEFNFKRVRVSTFHKIALHQARPFMAGKLLIGPTQLNFIERLVGYINTEELIEAMSVTNKMVQDILSGKDVDADLSNDDIEVIIESYNELKIANKVYDFDDVLDANIKGLKDGTIKALNVSHILVDEFQDVDTGQYNWLKEHVEQGSILTAVGDDDQSIYSWRGAKSYKLMVKYKREYDPSVHMLTKCFRCRPEIISATKNMIEFNADRIPKEMKSFKEPGGKVKIYHHLSHKSQYVTFLENYNRIGGEWAILCRTNILLKEVAEFLTENCLPFTTSSNKSIFDTQAGHFIVKLSCLLFDHNKYSSFTAEILGYLKEREDVTAVIVNAIESKVDVKEALENYGVDIDKTSFSLFYNNQHLFNESLNLLQVETYVSLLVDSIKNCRKSECAIEESLLKSLIAHNISWKQCLALYESKLSPQSEDPTIEEQSISLFTFHAAKGLEWENVAIFDVVEGVIPSKKAELLEEERRLMLVGMTRAEENLFIHGYSVCDVAGTLPAVNDTGLGAEHYLDKEPLKIPKNVLAKDKRILSRFIDEILFVESEVEEMEAVSA